MKMFTTCIILIFVNSARSVTNNMAEDEEIRIENYTEFDEALLLHKYFVDKTLLIKDFLDLERYTFVSRPQRWGKTVNLNMLKKFFQIQVDEFGNYLPENTNRILFEGGCYNETGKCLKKLKISQNFPEIVEQHQGKYPVIYINFKNLFRLNHRDFMRALSDEIRSIYKRFGFLKKYYKTSNGVGDDTKLAKSDTRQLKEYMEGSCDVDFAQGMRLLIKTLRVHFDTKILVFIDDFDVMLIQAYLSIENIFKQPYLYEEYVSLLMNTINAIFEDLNDVLGMMTSVLYLPLPEEVLGEYTMLNSAFSKHFGFTEDEVYSMLRVCPHPIQFYDLKRWYNGYLIGNETLFNAGSVIRCLTNRGVLKSYQTETHISKVMAKVPLTAELKYELNRTIVSNASIVTELGLHVDLFSLISREEFYTYLFFCGYFKAIRMQTLRYQCSISNLEMRSFLLENLVRNSK